MPAKNMGGGASAALRLGASGGLSADATAGQANALQEGITGSSYGRMVGMRFGVFNQAGPYGNQDYASQYVTFMRNLKSSNESMDDKIRDARAAHVTGSLPELMTSQHQDSFQSADAATHASVFSPDMARKSADFEDSMGRVSAAFQNLEGALGKPLLDGLTNFLDILASGLNSLATILSSPAGQNVAHFLGSLTTVGVMSAAGQAAGLGITGGDSPGTQALKDNTTSNYAAAKASQDLASKMPVVYGHDSDGRLRAALPGGAKPGAWHQARESFVSGGVRLGMF